MGKFHYNNGIKFKYKIKALLKNIFSPTSFTKHLCLQFINSYAYNLF